MVKENDPNEALSSHDFTVYAVNITYKLERTWGHYFVVVPHFDFNFKYEFVTGNKIENSKETSGRVLSETYHIQNF